MTRGAVAACADAPRLERYRAAIYAAAAEHRLDPALLAAVISRETGAVARWCLPPTKGGAPGADGHGWGPCQIDDRSWPEWCSSWQRGDASEAQAIEQGAWVLDLGGTDVLRRLTSVRLSYSVDLVIRAQVAAYNCGPRNSVRGLVLSGDPDRYTTGQDYSADVHARAEWLRAHGWGPAA